MAHENGMSEFTEENAKIYFNAINHHGEPDAAFCDNYTPGSQLITDEPNAVLPKDYTCGACEWYQAGVGCHNPEIVSGRRIR